MAIWMHDFMRCSSALDVDFRDVCLFKLYMLMVIETLYVYCLFRSIEKITF